MKYKKRDIMCPSCKLRVGTYDGRSTMNYITRCPKCKRRVVYHVDTGEVEVKDVPKRVTASGVTFW